MFQAEDFNKLTLQACDAADRAPCPPPCLVDCSPLLAKNSNLHPAKIAIVENKLQIDCPANGCYKLKLKVAAVFQPGCNYHWSFTCWQRPLLETQPHAAVVSYKIDDRSDAQGRAKGFAVTKSIVLTGGGYHTYTFIISVPAGGAAGERVFEFEISNENLKDTGGVIKISRVELKPENIEQQVYALWPDSLPPGQRELLPNQAYIDGNGRYFRDISRPTIIVHKPAVKPAQPVGVILCSGGSFHLLESMAPDAAWLNSLGITAFELRYRVPSKSNEPQKALQDAQRALRLVRSKAVEYNITKLGIMGASAGAHLSLMAATGFERNSYEPMDEIDQLICRPDFVISIAAPYALKPDGAISDDIRIDEHTPPVFFAHGDADKHSAVNSATLYIELRKRGIPAELHVWSKAGHGIGINSEVGREWSRLCGQWLKTLGIINAGE